MKEDIEMKRFITLLTVLVLTLMYIDKHDPALASIIPDSKGIIFTEAYSWELSMGYNYRAESENAVYLFSDNFETEMVEEVLINERIISVAKDKYGLSYGRRAVPTIFISFDNSKPRVNLDAFSLELGLGETGSGALIFYMGGGRLPAWLCIGLELYLLDSDGYVLGSVDKSVDVLKWQNETINTKLPGFGDEWFIPGFIDDELSGDAPSIAYLFVKYLDESGFLTELIELYKNDLYDNKYEVRGAEQIKIDLWNDFTGSASDISSKHTFYYRFNSRIVGDIDAIFYSIAENARHYFSSGEWTHEKALSLIRRGEEGIKFVKEWFDYDYGKPLTVINQVNPQIDLYAVSGQDQMYIISGNETPIWYSSAVAHETAHILIDFMDLSTNFPYKITLPVSDAISTTIFEEGLCSMLADLHVEETDNKAAAEDSLSFLLTEHIKNQEYADVYLQNASKNGYDLTRVNANLAADVRALSAVDLFINEGKPLSNLISWDGNGAAAVGESFLMYLLGQAQTKDDFLRAYADINLMESIYGMDMYGMFDEWLIYMNQIFDK